MYEGHAKSGASFLMRDKEVAYNIYLMCVLILKFIEMINFLVIGNNFGLF